VSAYIIVQVDVKDPVRYEGYKKLVPATLEKFGGRFLVRGGKTHTLEGDWAPQRFVIVEFPSVDQARAWWASPEYAEARALRWATAESQMIIAEGI
jgi:uncharacterized protein (DUF1330 family)